MKIKKQKNLLYIGVAVAVAVVGGFFAYKKGLFNTVLNLFKKKEA